MLFLNLYIPFIFSPLTSTCFIFILFQNKTPKCITEIPNQIKHFSFGAKPKWVPKQN